MRNPIFWQSITTSANLSRSLLPVFSCCAIVWQVMTRNFLLLISGVILLVVIFFAVRFFLEQQKGPTARFKVTSTPTASIFLDSRHIGRTPYEDKIEPGEYTLKLIPEGETNQAVSWQGKVQLGKNLLTYVNRELGVTDLTSAGEVLTLEKVSDRQAEITVHSTPDGATVKLDNVERGTTSLALKNIEAGNHTLDLTAPGFIGRTIKVRATPAYRLVVQVQLALGQEKTASDEAKLTPTPGVATEKNSGSKKTVKILDTPTAFLRVRAEPSASTTEIGRVKPGETFTLLEEQNGWYKIQFSESRSGWISGRYASVIE